MKLFLPYRIQSPTNTQLSAFFWVFFMILLGFGAVCLFLGYRAPAEKAAEAARAIRYGYGSIAVAALIYLIRRFFCA
jgi:hypothetical protein